MKFQPRIGTQSHFLRDTQIRICFALSQQVLQKRAMILVLFDLPGKYEEESAAGFGTV
jgi:hypothetical protein